MIDWAAFLIVFLASLGSACLVVLLYSLGIRFLATPARAARPKEGQSPPVGPSRDDEDDDVDAAGRPRGATVAAMVCFALSAAGVLGGVWLIVPALHG